MSVQSCNYDRATPKINIWMSCQNLFRLPVYRYKMRKGCGKLFSKTLLWYQKRCGSNRRVRYSEVYKPKGVGCWLIGGIWKHLADLPSYIPSTYHIPFPRNAWYISCPVEVYQGRATIQTNLRIHFMHRHIRYTSIILYEVNPPTSLIPVWHVFTLEITEQSPISNRNIHLRVISEEAHTCHWSIEGHSRDIFPVICTATDQHCSLQVHWYIFVDQKLWLANSGGKYQ